MNALSARINGQSDYRPADQARAAWREEMLDRLLSQMRQRQSPAQRRGAEARTPPAAPGKGSFVDLYV